MNEGLLVDELQEAIKDVEYATYQASQDRVGVFTIDKGFEHGSDKVHDRKQEGAVANGSQLEGPGPFVGKTSTNLSSGDGVITSLTREVPHDCGGSNGELLLAREEVEHPVEDKQLD